MTFVFLDFLFQKYLHFIYFLILLPGTFFASLPKTGQVKSEIWLLIVTPECFKRFALFEP